MNEGMGQQSRLERLRERLQIRWGAPGKDGVVRAMVDYDDLRAILGMMDSLEALALLDDEDKRDAVDEVDRTYHAGRSAGLRMAAGYLQ